MPSVIKEIKELAQKYRPDQIERCITQQLETGENVCIVDETTEKVIGELSKASFIRRMMDEKGMTLPDALRELSNRMRAMVERARKQEEENSRRQGKKA